MYLEGRNVLIGITGGIACYKTADVLREIQRQGGKVKVVMTRMASSFITPDFFSALSGERTHISFGGINHIELARWADILLIAPATANIIGKFSTGIADDLLTTIFIVATCPKVLVPSMNPTMWENPIVQRNLETLEKFGATVVEPESGELACGERGKGRYPSTEKIIFFCEKAIAPEDLEGRKVLVTAGATKEFIDTIRFISNPSTGLMGFLIARESALRGAETTLITASDDFHAGEFGINVKKVVSTEEMLSAVMEEIDNTDVVIGAAAVSDFKPAKRESMKIKKEDKDTFSLTLTKNPDVLAEVGGRKGRKILVGFALEDTLDRESALRKLRSKNLDFVVLNTTSALGSEKMVAEIVKLEGSEKLPELTKAEVARRIIDEIVHCLS